MREDQRGELLLQALVVQAATLEALEPHVGHQHVRLAEQLLEDRQPLGLAVVQRQRPLAAVELGKTYEKADGKGEVVMLGEKQGLWVTRI